MSPKYAVRLAVRASDLIAVVKISKLTCKHKTNRVRFGHEGYVEKYIFRREGPCPGQQNANGRTYNKRINRVEIIFITL